MAWDEAPPEVAAAKKGWDEPPPEIASLPDMNTDFGRFASSFADPATRAKLQKMAFTEHPINWMESHAGDALPLAGMAAGGVGGGALGSAAGPVGAYGGAVAGAGVGAGAGETLRAGIGKLLGVNQGPNMDDVMDEAKHGAIGEAIGKPVVGAIGAVGRNTYDHVISPVIKAGGKLAGQVLREGGVMTASNLPAKALAVKNKLGSEIIDPLLEKATDQGATVDTGLMTAPLRRLQASEKAIGSREADAASDQAKEAADYFDQRVAGTPAQPGTPPTEGPPSKILDEHGNPYPGKEIPGTPDTPAIPGQPYTPVTAMQVKTRTGFTDPTNKITPLLPQVKNAQYMGAKNAAEDAVERTLGPDAANAVRTANAKRGAIISSEGAQEQAAHNYDNLIRGLTSLRGTDSLPAAAGGTVLGELSGHPILGALAGVGAKKAFDLLRLAQMPAGYLADKFASSPVASQAAITAATSPWLHVGQKQPVAGVGR